MSAFDKAGQAIYTTFAGSVAADAGKPGIGSSAAPYTNGNTCPGMDNVDVCGTLTDPDAPLTVVSGDNQTGATTRTLPQMFILPASGSVMAGTRLRSRWFQLAMGRVGHSREQALPP